MSDQAEKVFQVLCKALETDQLKLPTLPEVALKIREAVEKDTHSAAEIAELLSQDTSLSARLLQLANSHSTEHALKLITCKWPLRG